MRARTFVGVLVTALLFITHYAAAQGSLTPPGAPAPSMKTLDQIEPRIPISQLPYYITTPGSYYVTTNLSALTDGIVISTNDVTLDLMGHTLTGDGAGGSDKGIHIAGTAGVHLKRIRVMNGNLRGFYRGIQADDTNDSSFENLAIGDNRAVGIFFDGQGTGGQCNGNMIVDCILSRNTDHGIVFNAYNFGKCNGNIIRDCTAEGGTSNGIQLNGRNGGHCDGNVVEGCAVEGTGSEGIYVYGYLGNCIGNSIADCTVSGSGDTGIEVYDGKATRITGCTVANNGDHGIHSGDQSVVRDCLATYNAGAGISTGQESTVAGCQASYNTGDGIRVTIACNVTGNVCDKNGDGGDGAGIHVVNYDSVVDGNRVYGCDRGIDVDSYYNLIIRNRARSNGINYDIANLNRVGVIVTVPSSGVISGSTGGAGVGTTDPWANFTY